MDEDEAMPVMDEEEEDSIVVEGEDEDVMEEAPIKKQRTDEGVGEENMAEDDVEDLPLAKHYSASENVNVVMDLETGDTTEVIPMGSRHGIKLIDDYDERMGYGKDPEAIARRIEREKLILKAQEAFTILVPATAKDIANDKIETFEGKVDPDSDETMMVKRVSVEQTNPEHMTYLFLQKGIRVYEQGRDVHTGELAKTTLKDALETGSRDPYLITEEDMVATFDIRNIKALAVDTGTMALASEFFAEHIIELSREAPLLNMVVPRPYLDFCFGSTGDGLGVESFSMIGRYMLIYRALEAKDNAVAKSSQNTADARAAASHGKLDEYKASISKKGQTLPKYLNLTREKALHYVSEYQRRNPQNKKEKIRFNRDHDMNEKQLFQFAALHRVMCNRGLMDGFFVCVCELIVRYAKEMEIILPETTNFDSLVIDSKVYRYQELTNQVGTNPTFLRDLFKLHCEYTWGYLHNMEEYLLLLCYKNIPIDAWDALCSKPISDPRFPIGTYSPEANQAISEALSGWERKTLMGGITSIRDILRKTQHQRMQRMGKIPMEVFYDDDEDSKYTITDETPRLFGEKVYSVPTLFEMRNYLDWIVFLTREDFDPREEARSKKKLFEIRAQRRIKVAEAQGRQVILHAPDGSTIQTESSKRSGRERDE